MKTGTSRLLFLFAALLAAPDRAVGEEAHFWLSTNGSATAGPAAPAIRLAVGDTRTLHIWGRPVPGKKLRNFSLNLRAFETGIDLVDGTFIVHNAIDTSTRRFEFVHDSTVEFPLESFSDGTELPDGIFGLLGLVFSPPYDSNGIRPDSIGIGPACHPRDVRCVTAGDGEPAWLIASVDIAGAAPAKSSIPLHLQIGNQGMRHFVPLSGDYDEGGSVGAADYDVWQSSFCPLGCPGGLLADGNGNQVVDAADYTVYRDNFGTAGGGLEPAELTDVTFGAGDLIVYNAAPGPFDPSCVEVQTNCTWFEDAADATIFVSGPVIIGNLVPEPNVFAVLWGLVFLVFKRPHQNKSFH
jgi:hypothetical protein